MPADIHPANSISQHDREQSEEGPGARQENSMQADTKTVKNQASVYLRGGRQADTRCLSTCVLPYAKSITMHAAAMPRNEALAISADSEHISSSGFAVAIDS